MMLPILRPAPPPPPLPPGVGGSPPDGQAYFVLNCNCYIYEIETCLIDCFFFFFFLCILRMQVRVQIHKLLYNDYHSNGFYLSFYVNVQARQSFCTNRFKLTFLTCFFKLKWRWFRPREVE